MRTELVEKRIYTLDEVREQALERHWDINVDYDWWESVYADADAIGLKITGFDLDRGAYCTGVLLDDAVAVAENILKNHGTSCDTYQLANDFLASVRAPQMFVDRVDGSRFDIYHRKSVYDTYRDKEHEINLLAEQFEKDLCEEYRCILQQEYEWLTSEQAIYETLQANMYEFNADGSIY